VGKNRREIEEREGTRLEYRGREEGAGEQRNIEKRKMKKQEEKNDEERIRSR
jgi:hypothetical protein